MSTTGSSGELGRIGQEPMFLEVIAQLDDEAFNPEHSAEAFLNRAADLLRCGFVLHGPDGTSTEIGKKYFDHGFDNAEHSTRHIGGGYSLELYSNEQSRIPVSWPPGINSQLPAPRQLTVTRIALIVRALSREIASIRSIVSDLAHVVDPLVAEVDRLTALDRLGFGRDLQGSIVTMLGPPSGIQTFIRHIQEQVSSVATRSLMMCT